jgi:hypothetical protein
MGLFVRFEYGTASQQFQLTGRKLPFRDSRQNSNSFSDLPISEILGNKKPDFLGPGIGMYLDNTSELMEHTNVCCAVDYLEPSSLS